MARQLNVASTFFVEHFGSTFGSFINRTRIKYRIQTIEYALSLYSRARDTVRQADVFYVFMQLVTTRERCDDEHLWGAWGLCLTFSNF